jgi:hypothetical protein
MNVVKYTLKLVNIGLICHAGLVAVGHADYIDNTQIVIAAKVLVQLKYLG